MTRRPHILFVLALLAAIVSGCAASGEYFTGFQTPEPGRAEIIVFRESALKGSVDKYIVKLDGQEVGVLRNGGWLSLMTQPGEHLVEYVLNIGKQKSDELVVNATAEMPVVVQTMGRELGLMNVTVIGGSPAVTAFGAIPLPRAVGPSRIREIPAETALAVLKTLKRSDDRP